MAQIFVGTPSGGGIDLTCRKVVRQGLPAIQHRNNARPKVPGGVCMADELDSEEVLKIQTLYGGVYDSGVAIDQGGVRHAPAKELDDDFRTDARGIAHCDSKRQ